MDGDKILALVFSKELLPDGVQFLTPVDYPLQVGLQDYKADKTVELHRHPPIKRVIKTTQEMVYVEKGSAQVTVVAEDWRPVDEVVLSAGDFILFVAGGHGLKIKKGSRLIEVKQGPYPGDDRAKIYKK